MLLGLSNYLESNLLDTWKHLANVKTNAGTRKDQESLECLYIYMIYICIHTHIYKCKYIYILYNIIYIYIFFKKKDREVRFKK